MKTIRPTMIFQCGLFHRNLNKYVVRNLTELRQVSWANAPRWISQPQNFSDAVTSGVEFELRGRAADLMPQWFSQVKALSIRSSLSIYIFIVTGQAQTIDWTASNDGLPTWGLTSASAVFH